MRSSFFKLMLVAACLALASAPLFAQDQDSQRRPRITALMTSFEETPMTLSTPARGLFQAELDLENEVIRFRMRYAGFATPVMASHLHLGARGISGGVFTFLCGGGGRPACPQSEGTVEGEITASNIMALSGQGLEAGDFRAVVRAILAGAVYANIHTMRFPGGEARGQLQVRARQDDDGSDQDFEK